MQTSGRGGQTCRRERVCWWRRLSSTRMPCSSAAFAASRWRHGISLNRAAPGNPDSHTSVVSTWGNLEFCHSRQTHPTHTARTFDQWLTSGFLTAEALACLWHNNELVLLRLFWGKKTSGRLFFKFQVLFFSFPGVTGPSGTIKCTAAYVPITWWRYGIRSDSRTQRDLRPKCNKTTQPTFIQVFLSTLPSLDAFVIPVLVRLFFLWTSMLCRTLFIRRTYYFVSVPKENLISQVIILHTTFLVIWAG